MQNLHPSVYLPQATDRDRPSVLHLKIEYHNRKKMSTGKFRYRPYSKRNLTLENSIGIESHSNRYFYDHKTVRFENLLGGYAVVVEEVDSKGTTNGKRVRSNKAITIYPRTKINADLALAVSEGKLLDITKRENTFSLGYEGPIPKQPYEKMFSLKI